MLFFRIMLNIICEVLMKKELIKELEDYKYEYQYFIEKSKEIEKLKQEIQKSFARLRELKQTDFDVNDLNAQIKIILDKQSKEENALLSILAQKQKIEKNIENLPQPYKNIFFLKYISLKTFDEIALKMNYSTKRIYQLHKKGIEIYCDNYDQTFAL